MSRAVKFEGGAGDFRGEGRVRSLTRMSNDSQNFTNFAHCPAADRVLAQLIAHGQPQTCMACAGKTRASLEAERGEE
jgi:hypothetical protein